MPNFSVSNGSLETVTYRKGYLMKIFTLNDAVVRSLRKHHPILQGKKLIASGHFSGVFESDHPNKVLKLSIDKAGYFFLKDFASKSTCKHFPRIGADYGVVGSFVTSKNIKRTQITQPVHLTVPIYLYEVEKLFKIPQKTESYRMGQHMTKGWRSLYSRCRISEYADACINSLAMLSTQPLFTHCPTAIDGLREIADFMKSYGNNAFIDFHGANFMQRKDGTFVFSDPVGDAYIYNNHFCSKLPN